MKKNKLDYLLLVFLALLMAAGVFSYVQVCRSAAAALSSSAPVSAAQSAAVPTDSRESLGIPILMYHGITESSAKENDYFILVDRLESDLKWLRSNGYTSILPSQLIAYAVNGAKLPAKPVILSFDDGYCNNYTYAFPLLQKYQAKAVIALIGADSERSSDDIYRVPAACTLSWGEAALMSKSGLVEFASHTYDLHHIENGRKGADRKKGESLEDYTRVLTEDLQKNQAAIEAAIGKAPQVFAWPYGAYPADRSSKTSGSRPRSPPISGFRKSDAATRIRFTGSAVTCAPPLFASKRSPKTRLHSQNPKTPESFLFYFLLFSVKI